MKKLLMLLCAMALVVSAGACGGGDAGTAEEGNEPVGSDGTPLQGPGDKP